MSYCFICGNPTPGSFGKCQACVERLAKEELEKEIEHSREARRARFGVLLKFAVVLLVLAGIGGALSFRIMYRKEWDKFVKGQEEIINPYIAGITGGIKGAAGSGPQKGSPPVGSTDSFISKTFSSGDEVLKSLESKKIDCVIDSREPDGVFVGNEVMYLKCDGEAAALCVFSDAGKAQEGLPKLEESKKYGLVNQVGHIIFTMVSNAASDKFDRIRQAFASAP